jgi:FkbM family methyltransferase
MGIVIDILSKFAHDNSGSLDSLHKTVTNWSSVLLLLTGTKKTLMVRMRNGKRYKINVLEDQVVALYKGKRLKFIYSTKEEKIHAILMLIGEFFDEPHLGLSVKNCDVVDIGAYIGDTAIYFALKGARHVYALEPYPYSYRLAKRNVSINNLGKKISMINSACGSKNGKILLKSDYKNLAGSDLKSSESGKEVSIMSLDTICKKYGLSQAALKIDCEGCEYDIILKSTNETLRRFDSILIEYHYGYTKLEKRLKSAGFKVEHTEPEQMKNANASKQEMYGGTILAQIRPR